MVCDCEGEESCVKRDPAGFVASCRSAASIHSWWARWGAVLAPALDPEAAPELEPGLLRGAGGHAGEGTGRWTTAESRSVAHGSEPDRDPTESALGKESPPRESRALVRELCEGWSWKMA